MRRYLLLIVLLITSLSCEQTQAQELSTLLDELNNETVDYCNPSYLSKVGLDSNLLLDTRKKEEYEVSHIPGAIWVGEHPKAKQVIQLIKPQHERIVVYCSVGVRSEDAGEDLSSLNLPVFNLYGGIFLYNEQVGGLVNSKHRPTDSVHTYSKRWSKYLKKGIAVW